MIFCWCLDVGRSLIRCAFGSWHTHAAYKVYRLSLVPLSEFGGHFVIHKFGRCADVMMMENQALYQEHFPKKSYSCLLLELTFWNMFAGCLYIHLQEWLFPAGYLKLGCELPTLYSWLGCGHDFKGEKDKDLESYRRESSRRMSWLSNGYSGAGIPDILGSFPIQVTNLSLPIYWGDFSWKGLSKKNFS